MINKAFFVLAAIAAIVAILPSTAFATILPPGGVLVRGQVLYSDGQQRYRLEMQTDGNLVYYRNIDNKVRFATMQFGSYVTMQTDGNFVQYPATGAALWHTHTFGNPGASLSIQDDGNLVVYSSSGTPLWHIGADNDHTPPTNIGDVVARNLDYPGLGSLGHTGIWTGSNVIEVVNQKKNAVRYSTWDEFRSTSPVWPTARPNIPNHNIYYCFNNSFCNYGAYPAISARAAVAARAAQIQRIGADYSFSTETRAAAPADPAFPAVRGLYRCDTFVIDAFMNSAGHNWGKYVPPAWNTRMDDLYWGVITPATVWNKLKN